MKNPLMISSTYNMEFLKFYHNFLGKTFLNIKTPLYIYKSITNVNIYDSNNA